MLGIIGGTGFDEGVIPFKKEKVKTEYGTVDVFIKDEIVFLPRHSEGHTVPPHKINYRANIRALKLLGIEKAVGIYAVGSVTENIKPMEWGFLKDFADFSGRSVTFFDEKPEHTEIDHPFSEKLTHDLSVKAEKLFSRKFFTDCVYFNTNGPRLETPAEIRAYRLLGADVVGMTAATETTLFNEDRIEFAGIAYSINWAAGIKGDISFVGKEKREKIKNEISQLLSIEKLI